MTNDQMGSASKGVGDGAFWDLIAIGIWTLVIGHLTGIIREGVRD
jgi:hypothetical protein